MNEFPSKNCQHLGRSVLSHSMLTFLGPIADRFPINRAVTIVFFLLHFRWFVQLTFRSTVTLILSKNTVNVCTYIHPTQRYGGSELTGWWIQWALPSRRMDLSGKIGCAGSFGFFFAIFIFFLTFSRKWLSLLSHFLRCVWYLCLWCSLGLDD